LGGLDFYKTMVSMGNFKKSEDMDDAYDFLREVIPEDR
jgi:hypothetical protein